MSCIYPVVVFPKDNGHFISSYDPFKKYVIAMSKENGMAWYAYKVEFKNRTEAEVVVYGMKDNYYGGIGSEVYRFEVGCPTSESNPAILAKARQMAVIEREMEIEKEEEEKISAIERKIIDKAFM